MRSALLLLLLGWAGSATAEDDRWYTLDDGAKVLVELDVSNVHRVDKGVAAWTRRTYKEEQPPLIDGEGRYRVERTLQYVDCPQWQAALKMSVRYDTEGTSVGTYTAADGDLKWNPLVPDSSGDHLAKLACGIVKGNERRAAQHGANAASKPAPH